MTDEIRPTSLEEAEALMRSYKTSGDLSQRNALVLYYSSQIDIAIRGMRSILLSNIPYEDFYNQGVIALIECIDRFDPDRGASFSTYIYRGIRGALLNYLRRQHWLPNRVRAARRDMTRERARLQTERMREPTDAELAEALGITERKLGQLQMEISAADAVSLEEMLEESYGSLLPDRQNAFEDTASQKLLRRELHDALSEAITSLTPKQRQVITLCYYENLNLREIGEVLGLTQQRVSQIRSAAVARLAAALTQDGLIETH